MASTIHNSYTRPSTFVQQIGIKLDTRNYLSWKQQVEEWEEIHKFFHTQMNAKSKQLRFELKTITKGEYPIAEYFARIQAIVDVLLSIGDLVSNRDHLDAVLDGLPKNTRLFNIALNLDILEVESMPLMHESKLEKSKSLIFPLSFYRNESVLSMSIPFITVPPFLSLTLGISKFERFIPSGKIIGSKNVHQTAS
ncbi:hypothetical protein CR513_47903, partial [Mucuna pruriens]